MREIVNVEGEEFSIAANNTVNLSETINFNGTWNSDNIKVVVFIQNQSTKEIFQSASISYSDLVLTDVSNIKTISNKFKLYQNYPNPFNPTTTINYTIASNINNVNENVQLVVYDVLGKEIAVLVNESQSAGEYEVDFDAENISGGFYFYQLKVGNYNETRKMILLK
jgi:hypothetical protein